MRACNLKPIATSFPTMKKILPLAFVLLSLATATAFAESATVPVVPDQTEHAPAKVAKKHAKHHKKHHKKKKAV